MELWTVPEVPITLVLHQQRWNSSVAMTIGYLKGKSATRIHREFLHTRGTLVGRSFWGGYCVSTVGLDEEQIRRYICEQGKLQRDRG
jgi:putative transposase